jgi:hypothetical protein
MFPSGNIVRERSKFGENVPVWELLTQEGQEVPTLASVMITSSITLTSAGYDTVRDVPIATLPTPMPGVTGR